MIKESKKLTPLQVYHSALATGNYQEDPAQAQAMTLLDALYQRIEKSFWWQRRHDKRQGIYLYGDVGAGKTWMMDMFYQCLTVKKARWHFHQFMREIHEALAKFQGEKNPLKKIASELAKRAKVICFDELFVNDIADAMLLGELFDALFEQGVFFVMTSNVPPNLLYRNGLQRARFYPAIQLLESQLQRVQVKSLMDYRWLQAVSEGIYFEPLNETTALSLQKVFDQLSHDEEKRENPLMINHREIFYTAQTDHVLWCTFTQLCAVPRSVQDYVSLSQQFNTFILDDVPVLADENDNAAWYLISLVDVLYDAKCRLIIRAAAPPQNLYHGEKLHFEYQRTLSRLQEMQTQSYWQ